jgi:predicted enzyme related to lactoylglutathione lyase
MNSVPVVSDIGQIALTVSDVAQARTFYRDVLGLTFLFDAGPDLTFLAAGSVRILLSKPEGNGVVGKNSVLYFRTSSVESSFKTVVERGAKAERGAHLVVKMPDHELWMAFVRDPDGNLIGLMEERR